MENSPPVLENPRKETKLTRIPKPFTIESLISPRTETIGIRQNILENQCPPGFPSNFNLPPHFPMYNPWVGYLSQTANERISQFFSNSDEKLTHFLDSSEVNHEKLSEVFFTHQQAAQDPRYFLNPEIIHREKLAEYFVNNIREPNKEKLSEFLLSASDYSGLLSEKEKFGSMEKYFNHNGLPPDAAAEIGVNRINELFVKTDERGDIESGDSCSDLSLTFSPNDERNRGLLIFLVD